MPSSTRSAIIASAANSCRPPALFLPSASPAAKLLALANRCERTFTRSIPSTQPDRGRILGRQTQTLLPSTWQNHRYTIAPGPAPRSHLQPLPPQAIFFKSEDVNRANLSHKSASGVLLAPGELSGLPVIRSGPTFPSLPYRRDGRLSSHDLRDLGNFRIFAGEFPSPVSKMH